ncbi:hypothetical protein SRHO_G00051120 [Serrasalmus rhombeus]
MSYLTIIFVEIIVLICLLESESTPRFLEPNSPRLNECSPCACAVSLPARSAVTLQPSDPPLSSDSALSHHSAIDCWSLRKRLDKTDAGQAGFDDRSSGSGHNSQSAEFTFVERPLTDRGTLFGAAHNLLQIKNPHCSTSLQ